MPLPTPIWVTEDSFTDSNGTLLLAHLTDTGGTWIRVVGWGIDDDGECVIQSNTVRRPTFAEDPGAAGGETLFYASDSMPAEIAGLVVEAHVARLNTSNGAAFALYQNADGSTGNSDILCWIGANGQPVYGFEGGSYSGTSVITGEHLLRYETDFTTVNCYLDGGLLFTEGWEHPPYRSGPLVGRVGFDLFDFSGGASVGVRDLKIGYISATESEFWTDFIKTTEILPA